MRNLNIYNIKKWYKMLTGTSILHVNQGAGKIYSKEEVSGYYNDLTEKVLKGENLQSVEIPKLKLENGEEVIFPIAVFQYGLGAYDLYLLENKEIYLNKFRLTAEWALANQEENGAWSNFFFEYPKFPYSAMAQGEGASLLIRAYKQSGKIEYLEASKKAIEFMLIPLEDGGTALFINDNVFLQEFIHKPTVLNGWIFALFGLFDYVKISGDHKIREYLNKTIHSIAVNLHNFDNGYWSMYDIDKMLTSPFYHNLHIAQLEVLYDLFGVKEFKEYCDRWTGYNENWANKTRAFVVKAIQKLTEK
jgi:heparosan-N-sulfate-glucuronate 5-epimerase